jgi:hypothetical protein
VKKPTSGVLGGWCGVLERVRDDFHRTEHESAVLMRRLLARVVRIFFEGLVLAVIAIAELDVLRRKAGKALVARSKSSR